MKKITNCLWFETQAEEAAKFYASVFRNAQLGEVVRAPAGGEPYTKEGQVLTAELANPRPLLARAIAKTRQDARADQNL